MDDPALSTPRPPLAPARLVRWLWRLALDVIDEYRRDGVGDLAAAITFWTLLSIPALVLALVSAASSLGSVVGADVADDIEAEVLAFVRDTFANSPALERAVSELFAAGDARVITAASAAALYSLSRGFAGLIRALDDAYNVEDGRPWWMVRIVAVVLGMGTVVIVAAVATGIALVPEMPGNAGAVIAVPVGVAVLVGWALVLFHVGPNHRSPWRYDLPGALITTAGWLVATQGFAWYVRLSSDANRVQGTVGAVLLGLTLLYLLSTVMLVGAEVNDVITTRAGIDTTRPAIGERISDLRDRFDDRT